MHKVISETYLVVTTFKEIKESWEKIEYKSFKLSSNAFKYMSQAKSFWAKEDYFYNVLQNLIVDKEDYFSIINDDFYIQIKLFPLQIDDYLNDGSNNNLLDTIISDVCDSFEVTKDDLTGRSRKNTCSYARFAFVEIARFLSVPSEKIMETLERSSYGTIYHSTDRFNDLITTSRSFRSTFTLLINKLEKSLLKFDIKLNYKLN
jgi:hypothetical protein